MLLRFNGCRISGTLWRGFYYHDSLDFRFISGGGASGVRVPETYSVISFSMFSVALIRLAAILS